MKGGIGLIAAETQAFCSKVLIFLVRIWADWPRFGGRVRSIWSFGKGNERGKSIGIGRYGKASLVLRLGIVGWAVVSGPHAKGLI